jgi:HEPN domain-containing protein
MVRLRIEDLEQLSKDRLKDAQVLFKGKRYDGAFYLAGYVVEFWLKKNICKKNRWKIYPDDQKKYKIHDFEKLLEESGKESVMKKELFAEWSIVMNWKIENRYDANIKQDKNSASSMIDAVKKILSF